jgi:hypothetical protein
MRGIETESAFALLVCQHVGVHCGLSLHREDGNCNVHPNSMKLSTNDGAEPPKVEIIRVEPFVSTIYVATHGNKVCKGYVLRVKPLYRVQCD